MRREQSSSEKGGLKRERFRNRFVFPVMLALVVMTVSRVVFNNALRIEDLFLYRTVAVISGVLHFASVILAAILIYPITYFKGATIVERVTAGSVNLAVWVGIDTFHVSEAFPWPESLYYGTCIGAILFSWNLALMSVLELACRFASKKKGRPVRVLTLLPFLPLILFFLVLCLLAKENGAVYFNLLLDGYLALFRS